MAQEVANNKPLPSLALLLEKSVLLLKDDDSPSSSLTRKQLVPVWTSLLAALLPSLPDTPLREPRTAEECLSECFGPENAELGLSLLFFSSIGDGSNTDDDQDEEDPHSSKTVLKTTEHRPTLGLFCFVFAWCRRPTGDSLMDWVIPLLLKQDDELDEDWIEAVLWVVSTTLQDNKDDTSKHDWEDLLGSCGNRLLVQFGKHTASLPPSARPVVTRLVETRIADLMQRTAPNNDENDNAASSSSLVDLVSLVAKHPETALSLSRQALRLYDESQNENASTTTNVFALLSVTTVLCILVPELIERPIHKDDTPLLAEDVRLWRLVHECLGQGLSGNLLLTTTMTRTNKNTSSPQEAKREMHASLLRRRGLYLLQHCISHDNDDDKSQWQAYLACMEIFEMESEPHLIDQAWKTVVRLFAECPPATAAAAVSTTTSPPRVVTWDWMRLVLARVVVSPEAPVVRKLALYRLFSGQAGILVPPHASNTTKKKKNNKSLLNGAPLSLLTPDFVCDILMPAYDTLEKSVGLTMHMDDENGKKNALRYDMAVLLDHFLQAYMQALEATGLAEFLRCVFLQLGHWHRKTSVQVLRCIAKTLQQSNVVVLLDETLLTVMVNSLEEVFAWGSVVQSYQQTFLSSLAVVLAHAKSETNPIPPHAVLRVLTLYPLEGNGQVIVARSQEKEPSRGDENDDSDDCMTHLKKWLDNLAQDQPKSWGGAFMGPTLATAFVDGSLSRQEWTVTKGASAAEKKTAKAICLLCTLSTSSKSASEQLWPAIHKGLASAPAIVASSLWLHADRVERALLLLEMGCRLQVLSGMGNGDLAVDQQTLMLPPPPAMEELLHKASSFGLFHLEALLTTDRTSDPADVEIVASTRSGKAKLLSSTTAMRIGQLETLAHAYPSSVAIASAMEKALKKSLAKLVKVDDAHPLDAAAIVPHLALVYAALGSGATVEASKLSTTADEVLNLQFVETSGHSATDEQAARSVFQFAKWGALSCLLQGLSTRDGGGGSEMQAFLEKVIDKTADAVEATPTDALLPLFNCVLVASKCRFVMESDGQQESHEAFRQGQYLEKVVTSLFGLLEDGPDGGAHTFMLDEICALFFQSKLVSAELERLDEDPDCLTPIRDAFRRMMRIAGRVRPHLSAAALCRITVGWLGPPHSIDRIGIAAIPYYQDVAELLLHKEERIGESGTNKNNIRGSAGALQVPSSTNESSIVRGFLLLFISKLPNVDRGLPHRVLEEFLHPIILDLFRKAAQPSSRQMIMLGTAEYCRKIRGWQALCVLSRFVTEEIAQVVCDQTFEAMGQSMHGQIRFFVEVFTIQCARKHPAIYATAIAKHISRTDLSLQMVASVMIVAGNLLAGKYKEDFCKPKESGEAAVNLHVILAGVIPWLGSTQSFSRTISQLLAFTLIPLVVDISAKSFEDSEWYLRSLYRFLEENPDMKRLRKKQVKFFDRYEVEEVCTAEGVLRIPVDEGNEADPVHLTEVIKDCLKEVYAEGQTHEAPAWKQLAEMVESQKESDEQDADDPNSGVANFQRKIIPLDALNLALEEMREKRLRNVAGRRKQPLIVCASLVDKVPNLGGLARTAEIFAADRLVIPDITVTKMDNFTGLSVGAGDWIEIEECKEEDLLLWLRKRKDEGYFIVGVEQTSSSVSLSSYEFPDRPTVLLLGKEKQGIPVQFLQVVDQCIEIPQLGIIRSLNVHVSGAITIWEYTRQRLVDQRIEMA